MITFDWNESCCFLVKRTKELGSSSWREREADQKVKRYGSSNLRAFFKEQLKDTPKWRTISEYSEHFTTFSRHRLTDSHPSISTPHERESWIVDSSTVSWRVSRTTSRRIAKECPSDATDVPGEQRERCQAGTVIQKRTTIAEVELT